MPLNSIHMIATLILLFLMFYPFLALSHSEGKALDKKEKRMRREEKMRKGADTVVNMKAVQDRWPFVTLWELYVWKNYNDMTYGKPWSGDTIRELRTERQAEIRRCLRN